MQHICTECKLPYLESSIQYFKRIKKLTAKICKECNRISLAATREEKRGKEKNLTSEESIFKKCLKLKKIHGHVTPVLLKFKFHLTHDAALELAKKVNEHNEIIT